MRHQWFTFVRLSDSYMTGLNPPFNRIVHYLTVTRSAAYGCLKPAPVGRLRRTYLHLRYCIEFQTVNSFLAQSILPFSSLSSSAGTQRFCPPSSPG